MSKKRILLLIVALSLFGIYLIWNFMLSLNREVTDAFQIMNEKLIESNKIAETRLDSLYIEVNKTSYSHSHKIKDLNRVSKELINHIDALKQKLMAQIEDPTDYNKMENSSANDSLFFGETGYSEEGKEFVQKINEYQTEVGVLFQNDFPQIIRKIDNKLNKREDIDDWLAYNFKGFPLVATLN